MKNRIKLHRKWVEGKEDGVRLELNDADFSGYSLTNVNLCGAILRHANFRGASLNNVNFNDAILTESSFKNTRLTKVTFRGAVLVRSDFSNAETDKISFMNAYLKDINLDGAYLYRTVGNGNEIKSLQIGGYDISYTNETMTIGCESHSIEEWKSLSLKGAKNLDGEDAVAFYKKYRDLLLNILEISPAI